MTKANLFIGRPPLRKSTMSLYSNFSKPVLSFYLTRLIIRTCTLCLVRNPENIGKITNIYMY